MSRYVPRSGSTGGGGSRSHRPSRAWPPGIGRETYRAIQANLDAVPVVTLSEAARSLGAGWGSVLWRVLLPNLRRGILAAAFITLAVVLGEFTIASLLNRRTLQTALVQLGQSDPWVTAILSVASLAFAFILLLVIGRISAAGNRRES